MPSDETPPTGPDLTPADIRPLASRFAGVPPVRPAGPDAMDTPPEDWDATDQAVDESFPASDPPPLSPGVD